MNRNDATLSEGLWHHETLANGAQIIHAPMPHDGRLHLSVVFKAGSGCESAELAGTAHFLEHMMFRGSQGYPSFAALADAFEWLGGEWNAATSHEHTEYSYSGSCESVGPAIDLFADFIFNPLLLEIEKERQIILREIEEDLNDFGHSVDIDWHMAALLWPGSNLAHPIAGTSASVKRISLADLRRYRQTYYQPERMAICVVGGAADTSILKKLRERFASYPQGASAPPEARADKATKDHPEFRGPLTRLVEHSDSQYNIQLSFLCAGEWSEKSCLYELINYILVDGFSARLPLRLREELGLVYDVEAHISQYTDRGSFDIAAAVNTGNALAFVKEACQVLQRFKNDGPGDTELAKAKLRAQSDLKLMAHHPSALGFHLSWHGLCNQDARLSSAITQLERVSASDIQAIAQELFTPKHCGIILLGPKEKGLEDKVNALIKHELR